MRKTIEVCTHCRRKSCDGGMWQIVKVISLSSGLDTTHEVHSDNLVDCTLRWFGRGKAFQELPVGCIRDREFFNWVVPSRVTLKKIS